MAFRVAIYTRLSRDATGQQTATARQEKACRAFAELRGWQVVEVFEDVDVSAYKGRVTRPSYERMLQAIDNRNVDGVLVWKLDRLVRRPAEFERFWSVCENNAVFLVSVTEPIDTSNELGLAVVRILVTFASLESASKGERLRAYYADMRAQGKVHASGRGYGYTPHHEVIEHEAAVVRDACERLLHGASMAHVVRDLNGAGETTARGKPWSVSTLRKVITHPRI